jgi:hypothetical protein
MEGRKYRIYKLHRSLIPFDSSAESLPIDRRLRRILEASAIQGLSRPVSRKYFETVEDISNVTIRATTLIDRFGTKGLRAFRRIESTTVMGIPAADVLTGLVKMKSGGIGLEDLERALKGAVESAERTERRARKMDRSAEKIKSGLRTVRSPEVPAEKALKVKQEMQEFGSVIRAAAKPYARMRERVAPVREGAQKLRTFADVPSVQFAAQSVYLIERSLATVEFRIKEYASTFTRLPRITKQIASRRVQETRSRLQERLHRITGPTLAKADTIGASLEALIDHPDKKLSGLSELQRYNQELVSQTERLRRLRSKDAIQTLHANTELEKKVGNLPTAEIQAVGTTLLEGSIEKQLVGSPEAGGAYSALGRLGSASPSPEEVATAVAQIQEVRHSAWTANRLLYLSIGGVFLALISIATYRMHS